jgi:hypothetical protein
MIDEELLTKLYKDKESDLREILDKTPEPKKPFVVQKDAENGFVIRYFVRLVNDKDFVVEVDQTQYQDFKANPRFIATQLKWKIIGKKETYKLNTGVNVYGVADQNRIAVSNTDLTFGGLSRYISDYLEFWIAEK